MRKIAFLIATLIGIVLLYGYESGRFSSSSLPYSDQDKQFANVEPIDCNGFMARWVNDLNQDAFPDLVVAYQPRSALPEWTPFDLDKRELDWQIVVLSGLDGKEISEFNLASSPLGILDATIGATQEEDLELLAGMFDAVALLVGDSWVRPLPGPADFEPATNWFVDQNPILIYGYGAGDGLRVQELQSEYPEYTEFLFGHAAKDVGVVSDMERFLDSRGEQVFACLRMEVEDQEAEVAEVSPMRHILRSGTFESGKFQSNLDLEAFEDDDFRPFGIAGHFDQNDDGQKDWLLSNPRGEGDRWRWFDGQTGRIMKEPTANWKTPALGAFKLRKLSVATGIGLIYFAESSFPSKTYSVYSRDWETGTVQWEIKTLLDSEWFKGSVKVTEFDDLDSDGITDVGVTVVLDAKPNSGTWFDDREFHAQCMVVSGKTGLPIQR